jgi:uncharacterized membrane protein YgcG
MVRLDNSSRNAVIISALLTLILALMSILGAVVRERLTDHERELLRISGVQIHVLEINAQQGRDLEQAKEDRGRLWAEIARLQGELLRHEREERRR